MSTSPQSAVFKDDSPITPAWKQEVNARLVAHRTRRVRNPDDQPALPGLSLPDPNGASPRRSEAARATRVAARVAERYSKAPSYREMLAAEAARAAEAEAAAQVARQAQSVAPPVNDVLWAELDTPAAAPPVNDVLWAELDTPAAAPEPEAPPVPEPEPIQYYVHPGSLPQPAHSRAPHLREAKVGSQAMTELARSQMGEICDPFEDAIVAPAQPLPVRILEFPRELIATRKARPRFAEGPLLDSPPAPEKSQLRIFEVESEAICHEASSPEPDHVLPEWHSIRLDAQPSPDASLPVAPTPARPNQRRAAQARDSRPEQGPSHQPSRPAGEPQGRSQRDPGDPDQLQSDQLQSDQPHSPLPHSPILDLFPLHVASIEDRLMAGIVDLALVLIAFLLFVLVFAACTTHLPIGKPVIIAAGISLVVFFTLYQWLFFTWSDCTPGMRYARIALCTFDDENPTSKALRWRIAALFLSAIPLGLGFLWALLDDDRLGWHDRITHTYQRSYR